MTAYYNEYDPFAAAWLQQLIAAGHIAPGVVDTRSIEDVTPDDLKGFTQCHFFAGIGVWSYVLRRAGWSDDRPIWTGSCPCQPFSAAGKGNGFADERHLWPAFFHLIEQCGPSVVVGEQVASKDGLAWLDLVRADVEGAGGAFGATDLCAAGFGAPHIRQRSFWVALQGLDDATSARHFRSVADAKGNPRDETRLRVLSFGGEANRLDDDDDDTRPQGHAGDDGGSFGQRQGTPRPVAAPGVLDGLANSHGRHASAEREQRGGEQRLLASHGGAGLGHNSGPGPTNGFWRDADWLGCRDGKWRPVEPGTFPLVNGATNRVGRLRGYGNAVVAQVAQGFIEAVMEILP